MAGSYETGPFVFPGAIDSSHAFIIQMRHQMPRLLLLLAFCLPSVICRAQNGFGAQDRLEERTTRYWWERQQRVQPMAGLSLIGAQWRGAAAVAYDWARSPIAARLEGTYRLGPLGTFKPDVDEWYDLVRLIAFARYEHRDLYARLGPLQDMRLGIGHTVNFYSTSTAWDARTVGAEFAWAKGPVSLAAFTGDVRLDGVSGGRLTIGAIQHSRLSLNYATHPQGDLTAWSSDLRVDLFDRGGIAFAPFASYAWYPDYGDGIAFGGDVHTEEFLDLLSVYFRVAAFYNSRHFIPGYVGALYGVSNLKARIVKADAELATLNPDDLAGITLSTARGVNDLLTEFSLRVGRNFSFWYYWRRHFGAQALSELHIRIFLRHGQHFLLEVGVDRLGEHSFWGIFSPFGDQSALEFTTNLRVAGPLFIYVRARYSFEALPSADGPRFLVQRRFEPLAGIRMNL